MKKHLGAAVLIAGLLLFGSIATIENGFGFYIKRSPGRDHIAIDMGGPPYDLSGLLLMTRQRYIMMVVGYTESSGLRRFEPAPVLP